MNQQINLSLIAKYLSRFSEEVKILNESGNFDINEHAENVLIKILNKIFDCNLKNVNYTERKNYPSIDLRDENKKFAFQVTATSTLTKVKDTLQKFIKYELHQEYEQLYIYILRNKQKSYSQKKLDKLTGDKFKFDTSQIIDKTDLYNRLKKKNDSNLIIEIKELLEKQFADLNTENKWDKYFKGLFEYDEYITTRFEYIDIQGFSPKVGNAPVKLSLDDIYIPQTISRETDYDTHESDHRIIKKEAENLSPLKTLSSEKYMVILGDPGSGKSTMLKHITYSICKNRNERPEHAELIPVFMNASEYSKYYSKYQKDFSEFLIDHHDKKFEKVFFKALEENNLLLLFDGLDEISNTRLRHQIADRLNRFISKYPQNQLIITSRKVGYQETRLGAKFSHYEINQFSLNQINSFSQNWYKSIAEQSDREIEKANEQAFKLFQSIRQNNSVLRLAKNPLLMTIIALIYHQGSSLPERRIELYEIATATFLENWVKRRKDSQDILFDKYTIKDVLSPIAFYMHKNFSDGLIIESEFRTKIIEEYSKLYSYKEQHKIKDNVNKLIDFLREDAGFIFEKGSDKFGQGKFGFVHLTFQEYFSALEFIIQWKEELITDDLEDYIFDDNWHEVILLTASLFRQSEQTRIGKRKATNFINKILDVDDEFPELHRKLKLVLRILRDEVLIDMDRFKEIFDKSFSLLSLDNNTVYGRRESSLILNLISKLLSTKTYHELVFRKLKKVVDEFENEILTRKSLRILFENSEHSNVKKYLCDLLENDYQKYKDYFYSPEVINLMAPVNQTKQYREGFIKYLNESDIEPKTMVPLNFAFTFLPVEPQAIGKLEKNDEKIVNSYVEALKKIDNNKNRELIADQLVGLFIHPENESIKKFKEKLREKNVDIDHSMIDSKINKYETRNYLEDEILSFNNFEIFSVPDTNEKVAILVKKEDTFNVQYLDLPVKDSDKKSIFSLLNEDSEKEEIFEFIKMVVNTYFSDDKQLNAKSIEEVNRLFSYRKHISWDAEFSYEKISNFMQQMFFSNGDLDNYTELITNPFFIKNIHIDEDHQESFVKKVKHSSLKDYYKLYILYSFGSEKDYKDYLSSSMEIYRNTKDQDLKDEIMGIIFNVTSGR